jgi:hypothetical protein
VLDQLRHPQSTASLAPAACNLQHRDLAGDIAELNRRPSSPGGAQLARVHEAAGWLGDKTQ